jgi:FxsC-like protein
MVAEGPGRASDPSPYFFLSYHRSEFKPDDGSDPDIRVKRFFAELCRDLSVLASTPNPGFMDQQTPVGGLWRGTLAEAIACCKVFVPLLTPGYFNSEFCGREWTAFCQRMEMDAVADHPRSAIVPVLWTRLQATDMPRQVSGLELTSGEFPPAYEQQGMFVLMRLNRYSAAYTRSILKIAQRIKDVGEAANLARSVPVPLDSVPNAFADHQVRNTSRLVRIIIAACSTSLKSANLPAAHRDAEIKRSYYYGRSMREWNPYRSQSTLTPIAGYAERVILGLNHRVVIETLDEPVAAAEPMPSVVLLDPWAAGVPEIAESLRGLDCHKPHVVVPWNLEDEETVREAARLQRNLREAMPNSLALNGSAPQVPTLDAFRAALPKAVYEAISRHFKTAPAYPPPGETSMDRLPRFGGPGP